MKAILQKEFGDVNVLKYTDIDKPTIGNKEVLIKVSYTSLNYADIKKRVGNKGKGYFPLMLGLDVAGNVEEDAPMKPLLKKF